MRKDPKLLASQVSGSRQCSSEPNAMKAFMFKMMIWLHVFLTVAMFHKRQLNDYSDMPPEHRMQATIADLFLNNQISGKQCQKLMNDGSAAKLAPFKPHAGIVGRNSKRNLIRKLTKGKGWPPLYHAYITCWDRKTMQPQKKNEWPSCCPTRLLQVWPMQVT